jgi:pimeloyl-ACP methyl ester carboxylesterase
MVYDYVLEKHDSKDIVLYGRSLGTGVASYLAVQKKARLLCLETPFYSIPDVVKHKFPLLLQLFKMDFDFPNYKNIQNLDIPVHLFHGTKDRVVPFKSAKKLEKHLRENDSFLIIPGGGHKNLSSYPSYQERLDLILGKTK